MNTWHRCLIPILGEDPVQCVGDFLPFEYLFAWQYPNLSPAMKTRKSLLDSDEYANFMYAIIPYEKYAPERKFVYKNYVQALEEGSMAHLEIYRTQYFFYVKDKFHFARFRTNLYSGYRNIKCSHVDGTSSATCYTIHHENGISLFCICLKTKKYQLNISFGRIWMFTRVFCGFFNILNYCIFLLRP